jgi:hypothetical protein
MNDDVTRWFCCLNPRERGVLSSLLSALGVVMWFGMPKDGFDAFWLLYSPRGAALRSAFLSIYGFEIVTIETELGEQELVRSQAYWLPRHVHWYAFLLSADSACSGGCQFSRVS